jgi:hypothetical protein
MAGRPCVGWQDLRLLGEGFGASPGKAGLRVVREHS